MAAKQNFVDYVKIHLTSGNGGAGSSHLRREKYNPKGGPDGGDGGRGGHVIARGNRNMWTLLQFKYKKHIRAGHGMAGGSNNKFGAQGEDVILELPLGTIARVDETGEQLFELTAHGEEQILVPGGRGGLGNTHFKSSTRQTPRYAQPGEAGAEGWYILELKLLADVGLVGFPNAGKSTLLSVMTAAKPEIANYPFTTLKPNLGMVQYRDGRSFAIADIPGIIEDAHKGKGLGHRFLRHIERNATLLYCIPADADDIAKEYRILRNELAQYNEELLYKPSLLALTKADLVDEELKEMILPSIPEGVAYMFVSGVTGEGLVELKDRLYNLVAENREDDLDRGAFEEE
ncbi:MAG: GTPase ObgE [Bacteroidota bacterium]